MVMRQLTPTTIICLTAALVLTGCDQLSPEQETAFGDPERGHEYSYPQMIEEPRGEAVYEEYCAQCHDGGDFRAPHKSMIQLMSAESIVKALNEGAMQLQAEELSGEDRVRVAEYLADKRVGNSVGRPEPVSCTGSAAEFDFDEPPAWPGWGLTRGNTRFIDQTQTDLNRENVEGLKLKWAFAFPDALRMRSQPAIAGGALIVGSHNSNVYALDRETACIRWIFKASADVRNGIVVSDWKAGDKNAKPIAYFGDLLGYIYAVDAQTGDLVWRDKPDGHPNATITGALTLYDGTLFAPVSSLEVIAAKNPNYECCHFRGSVAADNSETGEKLWQTYAVAAEPALTGQTRVGTDSYGPSGAPVWNSPAIDIKRRQLYFGTGENYTSPPTGTSDAILALDIDTGKVKWVFQGTSGDAWNTACSEPVKGPNCPVEDGPDVDFAAGATLATTSDGQDLVVAGQKSGMVFAIDPDSGAWVWKTKVGRGSLLGGVHFGLAIAGDKVFVPIADVKDVTNFPGERHPGLHALDLKTGAFLWRTPMEDRCNGRQFCIPGISVAITATPDLVLSGGLDGRIEIYDGETGKVLWTYDTARNFVDVSGAPGFGGAISGGAAPLIYGKTLYVSSGYAFNGLMPGNVLLAFE